MTSHMRSQNLISGTEKFASRPLPRFPYEFEEERSEYCNNYANSLVILNIMSEENP